jgi:hypothetical protein
MCGALIFARPGGSVPFLCLLSSQGPHCQHFFTYLVTTSKRVCAHLGPALFCTCVLLGPYVGFLGALLPSR